MKAEFMKELTNFNGTAKLWKVDDHFVVTSACATSFSGPETYVFPSDESGRVTDWEELAGSYRGGLDHGAAIRGYVESMSAQR